MDKYFTSDSLSFVASVLLLKKGQIEAVTAHPQKLGVKVFHLSPYWECEKAFRSYISGKFLVDPQQLNDKIAAIRRLPLTEEKP